MTFSRFDFFCQKWLLTLSLSDPDSGELDSGCVRAARLRRRFCGGHPPSICGFGGHPSQQRRSALIIIAMHFICGTFINRGGSNILILISHRSTEQPDHCGASCQGGNSLSVCLGIIAELINMAFLFLFNACVSCPITAP